MVNGGHFVAVRPSRYASCDRLPGRRSSPGGHTVLSAARADSNRAIGHAMTDMWLSR
jgi:hypothetical protein